MSDTTLDNHHGHAEHGHSPLNNQLFGFWLYLMTDCILFASLFATYVVLKNNNAGGPTGHEIFELRYVFLETMLLLFSSFFNGFAMINLSQNKVKQTVQWLIPTALFGLGFILMEINEFSRLVIEGNGPDRSGFLSGFFGLVGTHGLHVSVGLIWMTVMIVQLLQKGITPGVRSRLLRLSLFWHFLDVVWIGVFTVVYLMGVM
jgi:cytochrome o ubiquinol oxidase subunit 3